MLKYFLPLLFIVSIAEAQIKLSPRSRISVITCGPGQTELYSAFGHSAFRVEDPVNQIDWVYNYGVFDFRQKNFYLNFARGHNYYKLESYDFRDFQYAYVYFNRSIRQQVLNLTTNQQQRLFDYLEWNALPENKYYRYDYFYDNCATKIRDVVKTVFGDSVVFDSSHITTGYSIRDLTDLYLDTQPWGDLGIDICLGLPMDKKASPYEYMFLPDYVHDGFAHARVKRDSAEVPIVSRALTVFAATPEETRTSYITPVNVFTAFLLVVVMITFRDIRRGKLTTPLDAVMFSVLGAVGVLLFLLWTATDHKAAAKNFNILWALPTHVIAAIAFIWQPRWLEKYFLVVAMLSLVLLVLWEALPQEMHYALIPLVLAVLIRSLAQYYLRRRART